MLSTLLHHATQSLRLFLCAFNLRAFVVGAICLGTAVFISGCTQKHPQSETLDRIAKRGFITIGHREASIPFSYLNEGKPIGYTMDICMHAVRSIETYLRDKKLLKELPVKYVLVTSATRIDAVASGTIDLECGSTSDTLKRRETVDFSSPIYFSAARILVRAEHPAREIEDLRGMGVVTTKATSSERIIQKLNDDRRLDWQIHLANDHNDSFAKLLHPNISALVLDDVLLIGLLASYGQPERFRFLNEAINIEHYAIMLPKGDSTFKTLINDSLQKMIESGAMSNTYRKWFEQPIAPFNRPLNLSMSPEIQHLLQQQKASVEAASRTTVNKPAASK